VNKSLIILCVALSGCAAQLPQPSAPISPSLLQHCSPIVPLEGTTGKDALVNITTNASVFWECSDKMDALIKAVEPTKK